MGISELPVIRLLYHDLKGMRDSHSQILSQGHLICILDRDCHHHYYPHTATTGPFSLTGKQWGIFMDPMIVTASPYLSLCSCPERFENPSQCQAAFVLVLPRTILMVLNGCSLPVVLPCPSKSVVQFYSCGGGGLPTWPTQESKAYKSQPSPKIIALVAESLGEYEGWFLSWPMITSTSCLLTGTPGSSHYIDRFRLSWQRINNLFLSVLPSTELCP